MDKKHLIIISVLIVIIAVLSLGLFSMFNSTEKVHTIDVGVATFNCSDDINFTLVKHEQGLYEYANENQTYCVKVIKFNESETGYGTGYNIALDKIRTYPSSTINGVIIYNSTANVGEYIGQLRHIALIDNNDDEINVEISTPTVDETVLIASSFRFK